MKIYIARHGQAGHNIKHTCSDLPSDDICLTNLGIEQAKELADEVKDKNFEAVYISEFPRVRETAEIINEFHNLPLKVDNRLSENKSGMNGRLVSEYVDEIMKYEDFWNARIGDGESFADIQKRIYSFIEDLKKEKYNSVLIVAHSSTMKFFNGYFNKLSNEEIFNQKNFDNCQVLEFNFLDKF